MKKEFFKKMAIHPYFVVDKVEKYVSLMFEPFNQHLGMQLQDPSLLSDLWFNVHQQTVKLVCENAPQALILLHILHM